MTDESITPQGRYGLWFKMHFAVLFVYWTNLLMSHCILKNSTGFLFLIMTFPKSKLLIFTAIKFSQPLFAIPHPGAILVTAEWNRLLISARSQQTILIFRGQFKTYLFIVAYPPHGHLQLLGACWVMTLLLTVSFWIPVY